LTTDHTSTGSGAKSKERRRRPPLPPSTGPLSPHDAAEKVFAAAVHRAAGEAVAAAEHGDTVEAVNADEHIEPRLREEEGAADEQTAEGAASTWRRAHEDDVRVHLCSPF
jgi:uncharacterized protein (DUF58 family)